MSVISTILIVFGAAFLSLLSFIGAALFTPVVLVIDSGKGQARLRWLAVLEYRRPLPWADGESGLSFAGRPVSIARRRAKRKPTRKAADKRPKDRARVVRFLRRCLRTPAIRRVVALRLANFGKRILRSVTLTRRQICVSLPDPAWNGMLAGYLAWRGGGRPPVHVGFSGENNLSLEIRLYPYRIVKALLLFSMGLPYWAMLREWRAASAAVSG